MHDARVYGDTTECGKCGKQWDTNDEYPPVCIEEPKVEDRIKELREKLKLKSVN